MTREERHIAVLNRMLESMDVYDSIQPTAERKKAIKAAIQALSQEPCDDMVSRDAAIEAVKQAIYNHDSAIMRLTELPPVTQKSGKWKYVPDADGFYICSECGCGNGYADNFCPQCGAKMVELQESEDKE